MEGAVAQAVAVKGVRGVRTALVESDGSLLVGGDFGLIRLGLDDRIELLSDLHGRTVEALLRHGDTLFIGTRAGLLTYDHSARLGFVGAFEGSRINHLVVDTSGTVWFGGADGLALIEDGREVVLGAEQGLPVGRIRALLADRDGSVWVGTGGNGLLRFPGHQAPRMAEAVPLASKAVRDLLEDHDGNIWVGTAGAGLIRLSEGLFETLNQADGLANTFVFALMIDRHGDLWVGTNGGGVNRFHNGEVTTYATESGLVDTLAQALLETYDGRILVGTRAGLLEKRGERFVSLVDRSQIPGGSVRGLFEDSSGSIWISSVGGLARWREGEIEVMALPRSIGAVRVTRAARDGGLWVAGNGLFHWDGSSMTLIDGVETERAIRDVFEEEDGTLWFAQPPGLIRRSSEGTLEIPVPSGTDQVVLEIFLDQTDRFWLPTNAGLVRVDRSELERYVEDQSHRIDWTLFDEDDGLRSAEFNGTHGVNVVQAADGRLYFATIAGVASIRPEAEILHPAIPPSRLTSKERRSVAIRS